MGRQHNVVPGGPGKTIGDEVNTERRIGNQSDLFRGRIDRLCGQLPQGLVLTFPFQPTGIALQQQFSRVLVHRIVSRLRDRRNTGVIQIGPFFGYGHLAAKIRPVRGNCRGRGRNFSRIHWSNHFFGNGTAATRKRIHRQIAQNTVKCATS